MLLIEAFALLTSTSTTSSSLLLSAMVAGQLLALQQIPLLRDDQHGVELIAAISSSEIRTPSFSAHIRSRARRISSPSPTTGRRRGDRAGSGRTGCAVLRRVRTEPGSHSSSRRIAQCTRNRNDGSSGHSPIAGGKLASRSSANAVSIASIAAFTATAWWMIGTSPTYPSVEITSFL